MSSKDPFSFSYPSPSQAFSQSREVSWGAFHQAFCQCFSLTNFISYWNPCIWLAESKFVSEKHWQNTWWNAPLVSFGHPNIQSVCIMQWDEKELDTQFSKSFDTLLIERFYKLDSECINSWQILHGLAIIYM